MSSLRIMGVAGVLCGALTGFAIAKSPLLGWIFTMLLAPLVMATTEIYLERKAQREARELQALLERR